MPVPSRRPHCFLDAPSVIAFAHRGGAIEAPENTLAAFHSAARLGYTHFETDVHLTADGVVVAFHDASVDRTTSGKGRIATHRWKDLEQLLVDDCEPIPRMEELFEAFPEAFFNIDVKSNAVVEPLLALISRMHAHDRVCIGSFSKRRLNQVRAVTEGTLATSASPGEVLQALTHGYLPKMSEPLAPVALQIPMTFLKLPIATQRLVDAAHEAGMHVHVWTIDDVHQVETLLDMGVDGIMTDRPAMLKEVYKARGLWA